MNCIICNTEMHWIRLANYPVTNKPLILFRCDNCGLISQDGERDETYFDRAYSGDPSFDTTYYRDIPAIIKRNQERFRLIKRFIKENDIVLDFGAGMGYFLKECKNNGVCSYGIEISDEGRKYAETMLNLSYQDHPWGNHNIITLWDVIEHLDNPIETINTLKKFLYCGGYIIIETANANLCKLELEDWNYLHIDHRYYFTQKAIRLMMQNLGFEFVGILSTRKYLKYLVPIVKKSKQSIAIYIFKKK